MKTFGERPTIGLAVWRETLIDAAIFRESITNNSSRHGTARIAHFFCEQFYRAKFAGLVEANACPLPLTQTQLGEMLGMSLVTVNRHLQALRQTKVADHRAGKLFIRSWPKLASLGEFDSGYLHQIVRQATLSGLSAESLQTPGRRRPLVIRSSGSRQELKPSCLLKHLQIPAWRQVLTTFSGAASCPLFTEGPISQRHDARRV